MNIRVLLAMAAIVVAALVPLAGNRYLVSVLTLVFVFGYFGQAWNIMMGFSGQLSLGHGLFAGIGAYTTVALLLKYGVHPWLSLPIGAALSAAAGTVIGFLGFRFAVRGIYFTLLTIAFAECARIVFNNWPFVGGSAGLFLPAIDPAAHPLTTLRGDTNFYYYVTLVLTVLAAVLTQGLSKSRLGYLWRAIRDDEDAARAMGVRVLKLKIGAVALSAALTGVGGAIYALYNGSSFPDTTMGMGLSIEIIVAPIVGGLGTIFGPVVGAVFVILLLQATGDIGQALGITGLNNFVYGVMTMVIIYFLPEGIWPAVAGRMTRLIAARRRRQTRAAT